MDVLVPLLDLERVLDAYDQMVEALRVIDDNQPRTCTSKQRKGTHRCESCGEEWFGTGDVPHPDRGTQRAREELGRIALGPVA